MRKFDPIGLTRTALTVSDPEKLISYCRVLTLLFSITAIYLDPTQPAKFRSEVQIVLALYTSAALLFLLLPPKRPFNSLIHLPVHILDAAVLGSLAFLTNELASPFFSCLPFVLVSMTIRWGLFGALAGALLLEITLLIVGIPDILDGDSELNVLIMRTSYFMVSGMMLAYFGAYRESNHARLAMLANWQTHFTGKDKRGWIASLCRHAADVMGSRKLLIFWRDQDEPQGHVAILADGGLQQFQIDDANLWDQFDRSLGSDKRADRVRETDQRDHAAIAPLLPPALERSFADTKHGYLAPFSSIEFRGALWVFEPGCRPEDATMLAEIIARRISAELERVDLMEKLSLGIRAEERSRFARDMHDSVLQDLTAASLKLRAASAAASAPQLRDAEGLLTHIQRRIRIFIEEQGVGAQESMVYPSKILRAHLVDLERQWGIDANLDWEEDERPVPMSLVFELQKLLSEATANAVRHGEAGKITVKARQTDCKVELQVSNNGRPLDRRVAPEGSQSLKSRIVELGGRLTILDRKRGLHMIIAIPTGAPAA